MSSPFSKNNSKKLPITLNGTDKDIPKINNKISQLQIHIESTTKHFLIIPKWTLLLYMIILNAPSPN